MEGAVLAYAELKYGEERDCMESSLQCKHSYWYLFETRLERLLLSKKSPAQLHTGLKAYCAYLRNCMGM